MHVVSIQSRVALGYVGNSVAVPALQALRYEVSAVDTVRLAHHPGHGRAAGSKTPPDEAAAILEGVLARLGGAPVAFLVGYLGSAAAGERLFEVIRRHMKTPDGARLIVDPVMGDDLEGLYVEDALPRFYRDVMLPAADVILPNRFELEVISGRKISSVQDAVVAARTIADPGGRIVMVSSVPAEGNAIANITIDGQRGAWSIETPRRPLAAKGTGDLLSALFAGHLLHGRSVDDSLGRAAAAVDDVVAETAAAGAAELCLIGNLTKLTAVGAAPAMEIQIPAI